MSIPALLQNVGRRWAAKVILVCLAGAAASAVWALPTLQELHPNTERMSMDLNKSQLVRLSVPAERVSVVAPEIADVQIIDPYQILITAKSVGETSMIIWTEDEQTRVIDVEVLWNTRLIENSIRSALPNDAVQVVSMQDGVALKGSMHSPLGVETAMDIARSFSPNVLNLMDTPGVQQVMLRVRVAEVVRSFQDERGVNFRFVDRSFVGSNLLGGLFEGDLIGQGAELSEAVTLFFGFPKSNVDAFVRALQENGILQILAEPNLIARSGETASFLAGGEFPVPVVQSGVTGSITIEWKEFGVHIQFTPTILEERQIHMQISSEVSDLDFTRAIQIGGFTVPVVNTRRANTVVRLQDGQTFAIAGLINKQQQKSQQKIPGLGDIPLLGGLFKASQFEDVETEIVIMVTPSVVLPMEADEVPPLPTDLFIDHEGRWQDTVQPPAIMPTSANYEAAAPLSRPVIQGIPLDEFTPAEGAAELEYDLDAAAGSESELIELQYRSELYEVNSQEINDATAPFWRPTRPTRPTGGARR